MNELSTIQQVVGLICLPGIIFMLGFFTACLLAAAKRGNEEYDAALEAEAKLKDIQDRIIEKEGK